MNDKKTLGIIAYLIFFLPLLTEHKEDPYVKFHVKQAMFIFIAGIAVSIIGSIIPILGWFIIAPIGGIFVFVLWLIGILNAINGKQEEVPVIGKYAEELLKF